MRLMSLMVCALAAVSAAGCTSVPVLSLVSLAQINARTTDLARLRVAVRLPEAIRPRRDGVRLDAVAKLEGKAAETTTFMLVESTSPEDLAQVPKGARGSAVHVFQMAPAEIARFDALRSSLFREGDAGHRGSLGLGIATKEFCRVGPLPAGPIPVTTYLLTSETVDYVTVTQDLDLRAEPETAPHLDELQACAP